MCNVKVDGDTKELRHRWLTWIRHPKMENKNKFERMDDADVRPNEEAFEKVPQSDMGCNDE
jgi:hypothetical protein